MVFFGGYQSFLWDHWYPRFGPLVMSVLDFKAMTPADLLAASMAANPLWSTYLDMLELRSSIQHAALHHVTRQKLYRLSYSGSASGSSVLNKIKTLRTLFVNHHSLSILNFNLYKPLATLMIITRAVLVLCYFESCWNKVRIFDFEKIFCSDNTLNSKLWHVTTLIFIADVGRFLTRSESNCIPQILMKRI